MHVTLLLAGALIPKELSTAITDSLSIPNLQARLTRTTLTVDPALRSDTGDAHLDWLAFEMFGRTPAPTAPYAYAQLASEASHEFLWHADPVHFEIARDHLLLRELTDHFPNAIESVQLMQAANSLMSDSGCQLINAGDHWFLRCDDGWDINTQPLAATSGVPIQLPTGADSHIWNRLHNEIQMMWHAHPVNQSREQRQLPAVNGIWLHGGGRWQPLSATRYTQVCADAPEWQGAAQAAGARAAPSQSEMIDGSLLVLDEPNLARKSSDWSSWSQAMTVVDQRLAAHSQDSIDLIVCGATVRTFQSRLFDRFIPWRRRGVAEALAE